MLNRILSMAFVTSLSACSLWGAKTTGPIAVAKPQALDGSPLHLTGELQQFGSCLELENWMREEMLLRTANDMAWDKYNYFLSYNRRINHDDRVISPSSSAGSAPVADSEGDGQTSTNNQVEGMDENDRVKQVGDHIYSLAGTYLHVIKSWPAPDMALEGRLAFPYAPDSMLLTEGRAVVFTQTDAINLVRSIDTPASAECISCWPSRDTVIATVDISHPAAPTLIKSKRFSGSLRAARQLGNVVRFVIETTHSYPGDFRHSAPFYETYPSTVQEADDIINGLMAHNRQLINTWTLADAFGDVSALVANDCQTVYRPSARSPFALTTVTTLDPASGQEQVTGVLAHASEVYASKKSIYLANHLYNRSEAEYGPHVFLHKFSLTPDATRYEASGHVEGQILNQFSMDEKDDFLRIAVTALSSDWAATNRVVTLTQEGSVLAIQGQTNDLAPGETIYSVRFDGDLGYVVTFREVDPLFILDLSDPRAPRVTGQLKIPGFSSYLHKVGEGRLLGVGRQDSMMKLSLFDVSDVTAPRELHALLLPGWTEVGYDHHAFSFAPWLNTFVLPRASDVNYGLSTFRIENDTIVQGKFFPTQQASNGWVYGHTNARSVFRDNILYTLGQAGIAAHDLSQNGLLVTGLSYP